MSKEKDLCRVVAMAADQPTLLQRAIDAYKKEGLSATEKALTCDAEEYLEDVQKLEKDYRWLLDELYKLSGLEIIDIGYDDYPKEVNFETRIISLD